MSLYLNTNVASLSAQRSLLNNTSNLNKSLERLSSGLRINKAGDGVGELLASEELRGQIRGIQAGQRNLAQGLALLDTIDGALQSIYENMQRARELAVEAANGTVTNYAPYNSEINGLRTATDAIANNTDFNGVSLIDATPPANFVIQFGADNLALDRVDIVSAFVNGTAAGQGWAAAAIANQAGAQAYIGTMDTAIGNLANAIAAVGAQHDTLEGLYNANAVMIETHSAAEAAIRNTDVAAESANLVKAQILQQSSAIALAQANQAPAIALTLLQSL